MVSKSPFYSLVTEYIFFCYLDYTIRLEKFVVFGKIRNFIVREESFDFLFCLKRKIPKIYFSGKISEDVFNGKIVVVTDYKIEEKGIVLEIGTTFYADFLYANRHSDLEVWPYFSAILLKTKDDFYVMIKNNQGVVNLVGGTGAEEDFREKEFIPDCTLERELKEEIGLSLHNKKDISSFQEKYIKLAPRDANAYPCGILYTGELNYRKEELIAYFNKHKEEIDSRVEEFLFFTKENYKNLEFYSKKVSYLMEFMELIINDM